MMNIYTPSYLQELIDREINELYFPIKPKELYEPIKYVLALGGKRLRPVITLMSCNLFTDEIIPAIKPATGIELFHNFTLMHDDIMDKAPLRRGNPTVHTRWNESIAILSGDTMLVEAYKLLMYAPNHLLKTLLDIFNTTATQVCEGQQMDMNFEQQNEVSTSEYIEMIRLKTAVLLGGSMKIGALLGGANEKDADKLYAFGENLGIAFQLQDDLLDVYGQPDKFGKQVGGDIMANKKTFLLITALSLDSKEEKHDLGRWIKAENADIKAKVEAVTDIYNRLGIKKLAEQVVKEYVQKSFLFLNSCSVAESRKNEIRYFVEQLLQRDM